MVTENVVGTIKYGTPFTGNLKHAHTMDDFEPTVKLGHSYRKASVVKKDMTPALTKTDVYVSVMEHETTKAPLCYEHVAKYTLFEPTTNE